MTFPLRTGLRAGVVAVSLAISLGLAPLAAEAAGLGKLKVYSALGQPLRAEIELNASKDELSGMAARLAAQDTFKQAGIDYATTLLGIRFAIDKKVLSRPVIRLTSDRPINDPFVDMLLEIDWPAGRLVREYTFLLDPPEISSKGAQVAPVEAKTLPGVAAAEGPALVKEPRSGKPAPRVRERGETAPAAKSGESAGTHLVKKGETLRQIASAEQAEGVTLEQMLVGLYRANRDAFDGNNMNRLRAGRILTVPDKDTLASISPAEAKKTVVAQSADWNAYRRRLAGLAAESPAREDSGRQAASGKVSARVEDKSAPVSEGKDQVRVSRTETAKPGKGGKAGAGALEEDLIAKDKALKDASERLALLEKNVNDLQKTLELKNQNLADLQKQATAKAPAAPAVAAPTKPAEPAPAAAPAPALTAATPAAEPVPVPVAEEKPAVPPPAEAVKPPTPPASAKPPVKPVAKPVPEEEPSLVDDLLANPTMLAGGGGVIALLLGLLAYRRRKAAQVSSLSDTMPMTSSMPSQSSLGANSVFKSTGGQSVDTSNTPITDFSQAGPGTIDTDEVDPVAEADVYMAYGRDAQAEEILIEALQKDPKRSAIHLKLLEIYSNRKSMKQFETLASELYAITGGAGSDWNKAAVLGAKLDPANPLFAAGRSGGNPERAEMPSPLAPLAEVAAAGVAGMAAESLVEPATAAPTVEEPAPATQAEELVDALAAPQEIEPLALDFDLGDSLTVGGASASVAAPTDAAEPLPALSLPEMDLGLPVLEVPQSELESILAAPEPAPLEFSLDEALQGEPATRAEPAVGAEAAPASNSLDFELDLGSAIAPAVADEANLPAIPEIPPLPEIEEISLTAPDEVGSGEMDNTGLEFDVQLDEAPALGDTLQAPAFDLSSISLDLEQPAGNVAAPEETLVTPPLEEPLDVGADSEVALDLPPEPAAEGGARWQEVATKLDLAKAYEEMGDVEGARELLQEVLAEGDAAQQEQARTLVARIGG